MFKKLVFAFSISLILLSQLGLGKAYAQTPTAAPQINPWFAPSFQEFYTKVYDTNGSPVHEIFGERYTHAQVFWILYSLQSFAMNTTTKDSNLCIMNGDLGACVQPLQDIINNIGTIDIADAGKQPLGTQLAGLTKEVFRPRSLSGTTYMRQALSKLSLAPEVKAQAASPGFGFNALEPIRGLWLGARNVSYMFFILIIIFYAFAIMFRTKLLSPQAAVTVQSALPRIIIGLLLVTFSYAIAGLIIDLIYLVAGILAIIFHSFGPGQALSISGLYRFMIGEIGFTSAGGADVGVSFPGGILGYFMFYAIFFFLNLFVVLTTQSGLLSAIFAPFWALISFIVMLILFVLFLILAFRVVWMLIKALANIFLLTIFGPLLITFGQMIPSVGFGSWVKNLFANAIIFPLTGALLYVAALFLFWAFYVAISQAVPGFVEVFVEWASRVVGNIVFGHGTGIDIVDDNWMPPWLGMSVTIGGTQHVATHAFALIFSMTSLMILFLVPRLAEIVKGMISGKPFAYGTAIGEALAPVNWMGGQALSSAEGEAAYRAAMLGRTLQNRGGGFNQVVGRTLFNFGERRGVNVQRDRDTGKVVAIGRRGQTTDHNV